MLHSVLRKRFLRRSGEKGLVLVVVLLLISVLVPYVLSFSLSSISSLLQASNFRDSFYALRMARSGIEGAIALLERDDPSFDSLHDVWATSFPTVFVGEGNLSVKIEDEDGKININLLVRRDGKEVDRRIERHLRGVIRRIGGNPDIVDALIDWIDKDDEPTGSLGAESNYYRERGYPCKNGPVESVEELFLIRGFDREILVDRGLLGYITIFPPDGRINVNTAPKEVLYTLHPELREGLCEEIERRRREAPLKKIQDLRDVIGISAPLYARIMPFVKVNSNIFRIESTYTIGKVRKRVEVTVRREEKRSRVLVWREPL